MGVFCRTAFIAMVLALSVSGFVVEDVSQKKTNDVDMVVGSTDAARFVISHVDESALRMIIKDTVPTSNDLNILYGQHHLNAEVLMQKLTPLVQKAVQTQVTSSDAMYTQEDVTEQIIRQLGTRVSNGVNDRQKFLNNKRETRLNQIVQSMINKMWAITTSTIKDSSLDTYNIDSTEYGLMVEELIPELIKSANNSDVRKVLVYPVIKDELNIIIRKNDVSCSIQELTDKIFSKLTPFMREGIMMGVKKIEQWTSEDSLQQISERFEPQLNKAIRDGLMYAEKLQVALQQEMVDHSVTAELIEMVDPLIKTGVLNVMNSLQSRGFAAPGVINEYRLKRYIVNNIRYNSGKNIQSHFVYNGLKSRFQKLIDSDIPLPLLDVFHQFQQNMLNTKIDMLIMQNIDEFRRKHPQFTKCGANILAATVVGTLKANVKSLTKQYLQNMESASDVTDEQAVIDYVLEMLNESLPKTIEKEAEEQRDFSSGMFLDSKAFDDVKVRIESSIHSIVIKELQDIRQPQID